MVAGFTPLKHIYHTGSFQISLLKHQPHIKGSNDSMSMRIYKTVRIGHYHMGFPCHFWWCTYRHIPGESAGLLVVVSIPLKNIRQLGWLFPIYGKKSCSKPPTSLPIVGWSNPVQPCLFTNNSDSFSAQRRFRIRDRHSPWNWRTWRRAAAWEGNLNNNNNSNNNNNNHHNHNNNHNHHHRHRHHHHHNHHNHHNT